MLLKLKEFAANKIKEFEDNKKAIPVSWVPYLDAIKIVLELVEFFMGPEGKSIVNEILVAIDAFEHLP